MKRIISLLVCFFFLVVVCQAQLGVSFGHKTFDAKGWRENFKYHKTYSNPFPMIGWHVALDYHLFGAKRIRIEFNPEVSFSRFVHSLSLPDNLAFSYNKLAFQQYGLQLNTMVYFLDIHCDYYCDESTSLKSFFRKGLFIEGTPILVYRINTQFYLNNSLNITRQLSRTFTTGACLGVGLDMPFQEKITLTPFARFYYFPDYSRWSIGTNIHTDLKQFLVACRLQYEF